MFSGRKKYLPKIEESTNNYFVPCDPMLAEQAKQRVIEQMGQLVTPNYSFQATSWPTINASEKLRTRCWLVNFVSSLWKRL